MGENGSLHFLGYSINQKFTLKNTMKKHAFPYYLILLSSKKVVSKRRGHMKSKESYQCKTFLLFLKSILNNWGFFIKD
ncbi:hypothetical protein AD60_02475 [Petrotoga sp. SL27]|nr:hypothetical protein AD60_02475 [Petrotoga sp. SL27]